MVQGYAIHIIFGMKIYCDMTVFLECNTNLDHFLKISIFCFNLIHPSHEISITVVYLKYKCSETVFCVGVSQC